MHLQINRLFPIKMQPVDMLHIDYTILYATNIVILICNLEIPASPLGRLFKQYQLNPNSALKNAESLSY